MILTSEQIQQLFLKATQEINAAADTLNVDKGVSANQRAREKVIRKYFKILVNRQMKATELV